MTATHGPVVEGTAIRGTQVGLVFTSQNFAQQHPDVGRAFERAHQRTGAYITHGPVEFGLLDSMPGTAGFVHENA